MFKRKTRWHRIASSTEALQERVTLNKAHVFQVDSKRICVARNDKGFHAVSDKCPHQGVSLSGGICSDDGYIECPWHKYRFDLKTGRDKAGLGDAVITYPLEFRADGVYLGLEYTAFTLFDWLGED